MSVLTRNWKKIKIGNLTKSIMYVISQFFNLVSSLVELKSPNVFKPLLGFVWINGDINSDSICVLLLFSGKAKESDITEDFVAKCNRF